MSLSIPFKPFYFIRHGQTDWNSSHRIMGSIDIPLNQTGIEQAKEVVQLLKKKPIKHVVTSPLLRALKTAEIIAKFTEKPITVSNNLRECHWGAVQGRSVEHDFLLNWSKGGSSEGAEPIHDFNARVKNGLLQALNLPGPVLIVSHGGVLCAIQHILSLPLLDIQNCEPIYFNPIILDDTQSFLGDAKQFIWTCSLLENEI